MHVIWFLSMQKELPVDMFNVVDWKIEIVNSIETFIQ